MGKKALFLAGFVLAAGCATDRVRDMPVAIMQTEINDLDSARAVVLSSTTVTVHEVDKTYNVWPFSNWVGSYLFRDLPQKWADRCSKFVGGIPDLFLGWKRYQAREIKGSNAVIHFVMKDGGAFPDMAAKAGVRDLKVHGGVLEGAFAGIATPARKNEDSDFEASIIVELKPTERQYEQLGEPYPQAVRYEFSYDEHTAFITAVAIDKRPWLPPEDQLPDPFHVIVDFRAR